MSDVILNKIKEWRDDAELFVREVLLINKPHIKISTQQQAFLRALPHEKKISIRSGHGCHAVGTILHLFPYGFKAVEDVVVGDLLMGDDNTPREVLKLYSGREEMARIKYSDGTYYEVNKSHKLALVCTGSKGEYKSGQKIEITVNEFMLWPEWKRKRFAGYKVAVDYPALPVLIPPYILGMWLGDGSHKHLELTNIDKELIGIWQLFGEANGLKMTTDPNGKLHRLVGDKDNLAFNAFDYYGLWGNKHIPTEYLFNTKEVRLKLLAGLIDTDGYADTRNSLQFQIIQKRKDIADDILFLAQSCGIHATVTEKVKSWTHKDEKKFDVYYEVHLSRNTEQIPTQLKRKQSAHDYKVQRTNLHFGITVEELGEDKYYGFEVDKNHLYVLGDFTVTRNTGKDASASWAILWFMSTRIYAKVVCTAPTARQLNDILWSEISKWARESAVQEEFVIQSDKIFHKGAPKEWWARAVSPSVKADPADQAETLAGFHGDHLMIVVDEASGVEDPVFIPIEGALTQEDNRVMLIGNPTKNKGYFHDTQFHTEISKQWFKLHWDSRDSENVKPEYPAYMAAKYGVDSNVFRIRVAGIPPLEDERTLIPLYWAEQCIGKDIEVAEDEPTYLGVDVARYGEDKSIVLPRHGLRVLPWLSFQGMNTISLAGQVMLTYGDTDATGCAVDVIGVGAGVADYLRKQRLNGLFDVNVSWASSDPSKYALLRDELWWRVREKCMYGYYSFPDFKMAGDTLSMGQELANELSSPYYEFNRNGAVKVEGKKEMKKRGIASPNIADALCITEFFYSVSSKLFKPKPVASKSKGGYRPAPGSFKRKRFPGSDAWQTL